MADQQNGWVLLYEDPIAQVWGVRKIFDNPANSRFVSNDRRKTDAGQMTGYIQWPAYPSISPHFNNDNHRVSESRKIIDCSITLPAFEISGN
jgi:hypothetical protein